MISALMLLLLSPQDLFERDRALRRALSPEPDLSGIEERTLPFNRAVPDFAGDGFDWAASFRSLFDRNVKEEILDGVLDALQSELAGGPLVLACYASPTVCDAIKHYRTSAHAELGMEFDLFRAIEQGAADLPRRARARALKECLDDAARRGIPMDRARRSCRGAEFLRGPDGTPTRRIDVGGSGRLAQPLELGAGTVQGETRSAAVVKAYEQEREERLRAWEEAVRDPDRAPIEGVGRSELERIASMRPESRLAVMRSLAAAGALAAIVREVHEAERAMEAEELRASPEVREELERRRRFLRDEVTRLAEAFEAERRLHEAMTRALGAAEADVSSRAHRNLADRRAAEAGKAIQEKTRPWGCEVKR